MWANVVLIVLAVIAVGVAIVLGLAAMKPDTFTIERSTLVRAPADKVFALIDDFRQWRGWSPWERLDPELQRTYGGSESGRGATYAWQGNNKVGQGRMEIVESTPPSRVAIKLDFLKPFEAHNTATFTIEPRGEATHVHWAMTGPNLFIGKVMSVFMSMDRMIGRDFESGLANIKAVAEGSRLN